MKKIIAILLFLTPLFLFSQSDLESLVKAGISLHDEGKYAEAVEKYNKALKIDKKSSLVNYELGLTYFTQKEYKKAIKSLDRVIKNNDKYLKEAFMTKGSCLDLLGKPKEAVQLYETAIKQFPESHLLYYNLALTQFNNKDQNGAEENIIAAITANPAHPTSNYLLGIINANKNKRIKSLLAIHFFLLLEPNSNRSPGALKMIKELMNQGVTKKDEKNIEVTLNELTLKDEFSSANTMLSLMAAGNLGEVNEGKTSQELFYENTKGLFSVIGDNKEGKKGIWWEVYVKFFADLLESGNLEAYCYYISQSNGEVEQQWIEENKEKMDKFYKWASE